MVQWIGDLADPDPHVRKVSGLRLYLAAAILCSAAINRWLEDAEFRALVRDFAPDEKGAAKARYVVGIAVEPAHFEKIRAANGSPRLSQVPPDQDALEFELHLGGTHQFDILTAREPGGAGAIARYLKKFGEGIQQIELNVTDVDRATKLLRERFGLKPIYPATRPGADDTRVNFFLVSTPNGGKFLAELVEAPAKRRTAG